MPEPPKKHVIERCDRAERERRQKIAKEIELYKRYVEVTRAEMAEAKAKGQPVPDPLPHPDDVVQGLGRLRISVRDPLKRTWSRETRLERQDKGLDPIAPQLGGKYAPER